ncbi:MAG: DUF2935 domain-containing protein, partial [Ruminiclostridium sp.]|nr:DUF2935 domain-containing protein [Ruminiclostridium sp.]
CVAVSLSNGIVNPGIIQSGEVITPYTLNAEMVTSYFTGVNIPTAITQAEAGLAGNSSPVANPMLEQRVSILNQKYINLVSSLIQFKATILSMVLSCKLFTNNYPLLIDHIMREAKLFLILLQRLQNKEETDLEKFAYEQEAFWNRIMAEHAKFIRGLLDPTENDLIDIADKFGKDFDKLTKESVEAMDKTLPIAKITENSLKATTEIRNFKRQGTQGILECKVKSIILPLLADHTLREANHYLHLLNIFKTST